MKTITCAEFNVLKDGSGEYIILDVRNPGEFKRGHMEDAVLIPLHVLPLRYVEKFPDKEQHIVCCCATGGRASLATTFLISQGYTNVSVLEGGYKGYCEQQI
jgi:rhodanese-related sulfurtransferase